MLAERSGFLVVPYGTSNVAPSQAAALAERRLGVLDRPGAPVAFIDRAGAAPLRLHGVAHPFTRPPMAQDLTHARAQLAFLRDHMVGLCGPRNRPLRSAVAAYFAAVEAHVAARAAELEARLGAMAGLAELAHWAFSAAMPLPRAHVPVGGVDATPVYRLADLAFWDGRELIFGFVDRGTPVGARRRAMEELAHEGRVERLSARDWSVPEALLERLGPVVGDFTAGETLPRSPFGGTGLPWPRSGPRA